MEANDKTPSDAKPASPPPSSRSPLLRWTLLAGALALLIGGSIYVWQTWFSGDSAADTLITAVAQRGDLEDTITATGTLQPKDYVDVGTQVSGQLKKLHVEIGATVTAGQLLAEIDPSVYQAKVDGDHALLLNLQAQLADKLAQLELAKLQFTRQGNLDRENATTKEALQSAEASLQSAIAQADAVRAQIKQTGSTLRGDEANLGYTKIYAPMAGTVVSQTAKKGQTLNANQQAPIVMRIANLQTMTVQAQVSEADVPKLRLGMDVYFTTLGGNNRRHYGKLRQIPPTPTVLNNVVLYDALFDVENPKQALMTQMTAQVFFVSASAKAAVLVPLSALRPVATTTQAAQPRTPRKGGGERASGADTRSQFANGQALISVVGEDGKVVEREVKVGVMNRISAEILAGIEPGEKVVTGTRTPAATTPTPAKSSLVTSTPGGGGRP